MEQRHGDEHTGSVCDFIRASTTKKYVILTTRNVELCGNGFLHSHSHGPIPIPMQSVTIYSHSQFCDYSHSHGPIPIPMQWTEIL